MPNSYEYPPLEGKSPPQLKDYGLSYIKKTTTILPANGSRFLFSVSTYVPMGWDGDIGHGTSLENITVSTTKKQLKPLKHSYIYIYIFLSLSPDYNKIRISEQGDV